MTVTVLVTICFFACVFYVCVLLQWMRDTKAKTTPPPVADNEGGDTCERKRPYIVGSRISRKTENRLNMAILVKF